MMPQAMGEGGEWGGDSACKQLAPHHITSHHLLSRRQSWPSSRPPIPTHHLNPTARSPHPLKPHHRPRTPARRGLAGSIGSRASPGLRTWPSPLVAVLMVSTSPPTHFFPQHTHTHLVRQPTHLSIHTRARSPAVDGSTTTCRPPMSVSCSRSARSAPSRASNCTCVKCCTRPSRALVPRHTFTT